MPARMAHLSCRSRAITSFALVLAVASASLALAEKPADPSLPNEQSVKALAMSVLDDFMLTFNLRDADAHVATYHFPHYRLARGEMAVFETLDAGARAHRTLFAELPKTGWHRSEWVSRTIVGVGPTKIHVATRFRRVREDGSVIGEFDSLYVLTKVEGRWGVRMRSSFL